MADGSFIHQVIKDGPVREIEHRLDALRMAARSESNFNRARLLYAEIEGLRHALEVLHRTADAFYAPKHRRDY